MKSNSPLEKQRWNHSVIQKSKSRFGSWESKYHPSEFQTFNNLSPGKMPVESKLLLISRFESWEQNKIQVKLILERFKGLTMIGYISKVQIKWINHWSIKDRYDNSSSIENEPTDSKAKTNI